MCAEERKWALISLQSPHSSCTYGIELNKDKVSQFIKISNGERTKLENFMARIKINRSRVAEHDRKRGQILWDIQEIAARGDKWGQCFSCYAL